MRERTTWSRQRIASQLRKVAEDPRAMNQDHLQQQPSADAYVIGGPSEFAEDLSNSGPSWKADLDGEGNTKRDEIGFPQFRGDTFNNPEKSPGVSPSRQASRRVSAEEIHAKAELATRVARLMLSKSASEMAIENQALVLMDLPVSNLENTLARLASDQGDDADDADDDEGQQKQAADDDDDDDDDGGGQQKQAGELPKEFLEQQQKKKDEAKDKDKGQDKEARSRKAQQQDDGEDEGQQKQARSRKAQQQDDGDDEGQQKQAKRRKAQQQDDGDDEGQQKQAKRRRAQQQDDGDDEGQQKQAGQQQQADDTEEQVGKEAYTLIKKAALDLLAQPIAARGTIFRAMLPSLAKVASLGMEQQGQQQLANEQLLAQVQQMVQQAMQQQAQQGQQAQQQPQQAQQQLQSQQQPQQAQQQQIADQALVDQMLGDEPLLAEDQIQMDPPDMDLGLVADEDPALQAIFASDSEVQQALEARSLERGAQPTASRTASTRTVGTRPTAGVSHLGGTSGGSSTGADEINRLANMWSSAPDVSNVFRS